MNYVITKGKAGLGNRILSTLTALLYARLTGRRLIVDWRDFTYSNDGSNAFFQLFDLNEAGGPEEIPPQATVAPAVWAGRLEKSANHLMGELDPQEHPRGSIRHKYSSAAIWRHYSIDPTRLDYAENVLVFWSFTHQIALLRRHFVGKWSSLAAMSDEEILKQMLLERLRPREPVLRKVQAFKSAHFSGEVIGVHVRYMDRKTSIHDFLRHIDDMKRKRAEATIFLATDNQDAETTIRDRYDRVVTTPKWYPTSGRSMHQNRSCPDRLNNAIEALVDMYLLAECDHLIFPRSSTFSWLASLLSSIPSSNLIDIERYNIAVRVGKAIRSWVS